MAVTHLQVVEFLACDEPNYAAATALGLGALDHIGVLARGEDTMLAAKAVYLAALIDPLRALSTIAIATRRPEPAIRIAAVVAARRLPAIARHPIVASLLEDDHDGVARAALDSFDADIDGASRKLVQQLATSARASTVRNAAARALARCGSGEE
jgi:hypothetical protein